MLVFVLRAERELELELENGSRSEDREHAAFYQPGRLGKLERIGSRKGLESRKDFGSLKGLESLESLESWKDFRSQEATGCLGMSSCGGGWK